MEILAFLIGWGILLLWFIYPRVMVPILMVVSVLVFIWQLVSAIP